MSFLLLDSQSEIVFILFIFFYSLWLFLYINIIRYNSIKGKKSFYIQEGWQSI